MFAGMAYFWVTSSETFGATLAEHGGSGYNDIANFSPGTSRPRLG